MTDIKVEICAKLNATLALLFDLSNAYLKSDGSNKANFRRHLDALLVDLTYIVSDVMKDEDL